MAARILIVEDDGPSLALARYLLDRAGYTTHAAVDGMEGLAFALDWSPDLIVCDLQMPALDGYGLRAQLDAHREWRRCPIVALTALSMPGDREKVMTSGFDGYLSKPIVPETFVSEISAFLPPGLRVKS